MRTSHNFSAESARKASYFFSMAGRRTGKKVVKKNRLCIFCGKSSSNIYSHIGKNHMDNVSVVDEEGVRRKDPGLLKVAVQACKFESNIGEDNTKFITCIFCSKQQKHIYYHIKVHHFENISINLEGIRKKDKKLLRVAIQQSKAINNTILLPLGSPTKTAKRYVCPMKGCGSVVKHLARHLRESHTSKGNFTKDEQHHLASNVKEFVLSSDIKDFSPTKACAIIRARKEDFETDMEVHEEDDFSNLVVPIEESIGEDESSLRKLPRIEDDGSIEKFDFTVTPPVVNHPTPIMLEADNVKSSQLVETQDSSDQTSDDDPDYAPSESEIDEERPLTDFAEKFLKGHLNYLRSILGHNRPTDSTEKEVARVRDMFQFLGICNSLAPLTDHENFEKKILVDFRDHMAKGGNGQTKKSNNTMVTYLGYILNVLRYIMAKKLYKETGVQQIDVISMEKTVEDVKKRFRKNAKRDNIIREDREVKKINTNLSSEKIVEYQKTDRARQAQQLFNLFGSDEPPETISCGDYTIMKDYLIQVLEWRITQRGCVTTNLRLKEMQDVSYNQQHDRYVVYVEQHKTVGTHGPAKVTLKKEQWLMLNNFANLVRPAMEPRFKEIKENCNTNELPDYDSDILTRYVFAPWKHKGGVGKLQSGAAAKSVTNNFRKCNMIGENQTITFTDIRKKAVSAMQKAYPQDHDKRRMLAKSMTHREHTSRDYYERFDREDEACEIQDTMEKIIYNEKEVTSPSTSNQKPDVLRTPTHKEGIKYTRWSEEDTHNIREVYSTPESRSSCKEILKSCPKRLTERYGEMKVISKVRRECSPQKPRATVNSILPPYLELKRKRKDNCISFEDEIILYQKCRSAISESAGNLPKNKRITNTNVFTKYLQDTGLLERYSPSQIRTKLDTWVKKEIANSGRLECLNE